MATLITCKTCQNKISSTAELCPYCGHPHEKDRAERKKNYGRFAWLGVLALLLILWKTGVGETIFNKLLGDFKLPVPK